MPIISPQVPDEVNGSASLNTASQVLWHTLFLYKMEFSRAYTIVKKVAKGKLELKALFSVPPQDVFQFLI